MHPARRQDPRGCGGPRSRPRHISIPARSCPSVRRRDERPPHRKCQWCRSARHPEGERATRSRALRACRLLAVRRGEKVTIDVPLQIVGEVVRGGLLAQENTTVSIEAEATNLPSGIEVNIEGVEIGSHITAADLALPAGATLAGDPDQVLLLIQEAPSAEALEAEAAEAASELGIVEEKPEAEREAGGPSETPPAAEE